MRINLRSVKYPNFSGDIIWSQNSQNFRLNLPPSFPTYTSPNRRRPSNPSRQASRTQTVTTSAQMLTTNTLNLHSNNPPTPNDTVHVAVRVRPLNQREKSSSQEDAFAVSENSICQISPIDKKPVPGSIFSFGMHSFIDLSDVRYTVFDVPLWLRDINTEVFKCWDSVYEVLVPIRIMVSGSMHPLDAGRSPTNLPPHHPITYIIINLTSRISQNQTKFTRRLSRPLHSTTKSPAKSSYPASMASMAPSSRTVKQAVEKLIPCKELRMNQE